MVPSQSQEIIDGEEGSSSDVHRLREPRYHRFQRNEAVGTEVQVVTRSSARGTNEVSAPRYHVPTIPTPGMQGRGFLSNDVLCETNDIIFAPPPAFASPCSSVPPPRRDHSSFVKLVAPESEYFTEAVDRFRQLCEGRNLVANVDHREGGLLHLRLIDPASPDVANDPNACINVDLVAEGFASIDRRGSKYLNAYPGVYKKLQGAVSEAKRQRYGMFEFGDVEEDD